MRHYFAQIFAPGETRNGDWARLLGQNLRKPRFLMSRRVAISRRLRRNCIWMLVILLVALALKT